MSFLIGNTRLWFARGRTYSLKTSEVSRLATKYYEKGLEASYLMNVADQDLLFNVQGPEKHIWTILEVPPQDDPDVMQIASWKRPLARLVGFSGIVPALLTLCNAFTQSLCLIEMGADHATSTRRLLVAWFIIGLNIVLCSPTLPLALVKLRIFQGNFRPRFRLIGTDVPLVDVIIPCCSEPLDVLQDTILAAIALDYPEDRFRVIVTDDGGSARLRAWVAELGQHNLYYTARVKNGSSGFKAGNLNHAIRFIETQLDREPAEFIASLDADMIPEKKWLRAVTPHLVLNPKMGVVCPTQSFYNFPKNDPLYQSQLNSWRCLDIIRDMADIAWNTGSGFILRRQALLDIGGFPTDCLVEDAHSSMLMMSKGWKTAYVAESLQYGLMPESFLAHIKQFTRWNLGGIQMAIHFRFYLFTSYTGSLTVWQRLLGLSCGITTFILPIFMVIEFIVTPIYLVMGVHLVYFYNLQNLRSLLRIQCVSILMKWVHDCNLGILSSNRLAIRDEAQSLYMSPNYVIASLRSFVLPKSFGGTAPGFTPSGSISASVHERSTTRRAPLTTRLRHIVFGCGICFHVAAIIVFAFSVTYRIHHILAAHPADKEGHRDWHSLGVELIRDVLWPNPAWLVSSLACFTPIKYAIMPPDVPAREGLMGERDAKGARYPLPSSKKGKFSRVNVDFGQLYPFFVVPYVAFLFVASWWI